VPALFLEHFVSESRFDNPNLTVETRTRRSLKKSVERTKFGNKCKKMRFKATMLLKTKKVDLVQSQESVASGGWLVARQVGSGTW